MEWARYTNSYVCSYVFKDGVDSMRGRELSGEYTEGARDLVDELVGMAGWRLGGWLNLLVTGKLGLELGEAAEGVVEVEVGKGEGVAETVVVEKRKSIKDKSGKCIIS